MSGRWRNEKSMPGEKVTDDSEDSIEPMNDENTHQTYMDQGLWSWMQHNQHFPKRKENSDDATDCVSVAGNQDTCQKTASKSPRRVSSTKTNSSEQQLNSVPPEELIT
jgi:hypothetical protein